MHSLRLASGKRRKRCVIEAWSLHHCRNDRTLERFAAALVRYSCLQGRDILVHAALGRFHDWPSLARRLAARPNGAAAGNLRVVHPKSAKALARTLYRQQILESDLRDAAAIYEALAISAEQELEPFDVGYLVDALTVAGRRQDARAYLERYSKGLRELEAYTYLFANLLNPYAGGFGTEREWLCEVNAPLTAHAMEPVELMTGTGAPFYRLRCKPRDCVLDGPLVSVLMPVHESNEETDVAIESILAQSWRNLELIIVDDASSAASVARLKQWEGRDERLRFIYSSENRGAYCARNFAYELARGEFVTVADKDDWHHPRKIELHVRDLLNEPDKVANMSSWARVDQNVSFLVRYAPIKMVHPSLPSLFFRRKPVKDALGYWDGVRKGADGEYKLRIQKVFGVDIKPMNRIPLALSLMGRENLTSRDFGLGYEHPDRSFYKQTYGHWHRRIPELTEPYLQKDPDFRAFPAPLAFMPQRSGGSPRFDVVFALDLSTNTADSELARAEMQKALQRGVRIGVLHLPDLMLLSRKERPPVDWLNDLILDGMVTRTSFTDSADAEVIVLFTPRILQFRSELRCGLAANRVFVVVTQPPLDSAGTSHGGYCPGSVAENVRSMFDAAPIWVPVDTAVRSALRPWVGRREIAPYDWMGIEHLGEVPRKWSQWLERVFR